MKLEFSDFKIIAHSPVEMKAAQILSSEIFKRTGTEPQITNEKSGRYFEFCLFDESEDESFTVTHTDYSITVTAHRLRSLIYGAGLFIRKAEVENGRLYLVKNLSGTYSPTMPIRGHQLSYTDMNNTYDAWDENDFRQYLIDLELFGNNTFESDSGDKGVENRLMKHTRLEMMRLNSEICDELDLDFSTWHPLSKNKSDSETLEDLRRAYGSLCKLNVFFPPGGDPGDLQAEDFIERCKLMKRELVKYFPNVKMLPSAQAPHCYPDWGERLINKMAELPEEIDGFIYGPNHAMPLDEMRRRIDSRYPFRFYPDITHNVRCEVPVHFQQDDWHYALAATLSREAVNPRPCEYRLLHRLTRQYVDGSVSYSEGVNDDLNKFVWSALDFDGECNLREAVEDYARAFFYGTDTKKLADGIFSLEQNWHGDPAQNIAIDTSFEIFTSLERDYPALSDNWRFQLHLFRAYCDKIVRDRRVFELDLIELAKWHINRNDVEKAVAVLESDFPTEYTEKHDRLLPLAQRLNELIGIQLDVERFGGLNWERGCTLDTIDNPVTDRRWLLQKLREHPELAADYINRNTVDRDEYYFCFAEHGFEVCGRQEGEYYMNFRGDGNSSAELPMCMTKVYDHFNFKCQVAGLTAGDYNLKITYKLRPNDEIKHHRVTVNGNVIHDGKQFGGTVDEDYTEKFLAKGYVSVVYRVDKEYIVNGCAELEITEPLDGFMFSEFRFTKCN